MRHSHSRCSKGVQGLCGCYRRQDKDCYRFNPYKFSGSVLAAIGKDTNADEFGLVDELAEVSKIPVPASLAALKDKEVRFTKVIDKADMKDYIYSALGI